MTSFKVKGFRAFRVEAGTIDWTAYQAYKKAVGADCSQCGGFLLYAKGAPRKSSPLALIDAYTTRVLKLKATATDKAITDFLVAEGRWPEYAWCAIDPVTRPDGSLTVAVNAFASDELPTPMPPGIGYYLHVGALNARTVKGVQ